VINVEAGMMDMEAKTELPAKNFLAKYWRRISHWEDPLIVLVDKYSKETINLKENYEDCLSRAWNQGKNCQRIIMKENEGIATELQEDLFGELKQEMEKEKLFQRKFQYNKIDCVRGVLRREIEMSNNIFVNDLISDVYLDSDEKSIIFMDDLKIPNEVSNRIRILRRKGSRWLKEQISISNKAGIFRTEKIAIYEALNTGKYGN
jgi:hypothetical protein